MTVQRMRALDASFLAMETPAAPLLVGSVLVMAGPAPDPGEVRDHLRARLGDRPELRMRAVRAPGDVARPLWRDDPFDDAGEHVVVAQVAPPGGRRELEAAVARILEHPVDLARPPWAVHLLTGLEDGRWALVLTAHHVLVDGWIGAGLVRALLDCADHPVVLPASPRRRGSARRRVRVALRTVVRPDLPASVLAGPLGPARDWRCATVPVADLVAVARWQGCTVNDVYLAALASAYRTYLLAQGEPLAVRALVPVSMRSADRAPGTGNLDAAFFVNLPVREPDPLERLRSVTRQTRAAKASGVADATETMLAMLGRAPFPLLARAAGRYARGRQRRVNAAAPHVRGPEGALSLLGRRVELVAPLVPVALEVRTCCALLTCGGTAALGITADAAAVPDASVLADAFEAAVAELVAL